MTAVERCPLDDGARSRVADGAIHGREVIPPVAGTGFPSPGASSAARSARVCAMCGRPRHDEKAAKPDTEHAPCDRTTRRMEADLEAARRGPTDLLTWKW